MAIRLFRAADASRFAPKAQHIRAEIGAIEPTNRIVFDAQLAEILWDPQRLKYGTPQCRFQIDPSYEAVRKGEFDGMIDDNAGLNNPITLY
jgi:hypothetical protein